MPKSVATAVPFEETTVISRIETIDRRQLASLVPEWERLAASAAEPNVFYEPWMVLPALEEFHRGLKLKMFLIWCRDSKGHERLAGLFPFEHARLGRTPIAHYRLLRYHFCSLCTPLVDAQAGPACLQAFINELRRRRDGVYELRFFHGGGPIWQWLSDALEGQNGWIRQDSHVDRALFLPATNAEEFLRLTFDGDRRRELQRQERRLRDQGALQYANLEPGEAVEPWLETFLRLEAGGWKGQSGTAFASVEGGSRFLSKIARAAHGRGRLVMSAIRLGDQTLAMNFLLAAGEGLYAFRTAYAESHAKYSPGLLLSVYDSRRAHDSPGIRWIDSCSDPENTLVNRLWKNRRLLRTVQLAGKASLAGLTLGLGFAP